MQETVPSCALCPFPWSERYCRRSGGKGPKNCPSFLYRELVEQAQTLVSEPELLHFSRNCSIQEAEGYGGRELGYEHIRPMKPRIEEIAEFAERMGYKRLALIFCIGLRREAEIVHTFFSDYGFETVYTYDSYYRSLKQRGKE